MIDQKSGPIISRLSSNQNTDSNFNENPHLALKQARNEEVPPTIITTIQPNEVSRASALESPLTIFLLVSVGLLLALVAALCLRVRKRNVHEDHEKDPMLAKPEEKVLIVLPCGTTKTAKASDVKNVGVRSHDINYIQKLLRNAITQTNCTWAGEHAGRLNLALMRQNDAINDEFVPCSIPFSDISAFQNNFAAQINSLVEVWIVFIQAVEHIFSFRIFAKIFIWSS